MDTFAFIIHPIDPKRDVSRKFPLLGRYLSAGQINFFSTYFPPVYISQIDGLTSAANGREVKGWFVACPLTPARMLELPEKTVYRKIVETGRLAERLGARILGLGAFTSVVGDAGLTISRQLSIPVTTGDSYTIAVAVRATREAARVMDIPLSGATAAVVGATGAVGAAAAELIAQDVPNLWLIGRRTGALEALRARIMSRSAAKVQIATDMGPLAEADLILTVTSAIDTVIEPEFLRPGAVVCDVARPRDVSARVAAERDDVLVIDGGMVQAPGKDLRFNFDFGFPAGLVYACMAETMALAMEGRYESFTLGREITAEQVREIDVMADKHGFRLAGFRSFERAVTPEQIERAGQRPPEARARRPRVTGRLRQGKRVLLVIEDDPDTSSLLSMYFSGHEYDVTVADRGEEGVAAARRKLPDVVLLDIGLPDIDGYAVCNQLRASPRTSHIPVVFLSEKASVTDRVAGLGAGAQDYITKPFDLEELRLRVQNLIARSLRDNLVDPRSKLPTSAWLDEQMRIGAKRPGWHVLECRLEAFQPFIDQNGFMAGDEVLTFIGQLLRDEVDQLGTAEDFIGHPAHSTFVILTGAADSDALAQHLQTRFNEEIKAHYSFTDREQGYLLLKGAGGAMVQAPLMTMRVRVS